MAAFAFPAKPRCPFPGSGHGMRIVTGAAPQLIPRSAPAGALRQLFKMAGHAHAGSDSVAHENGHRIGQAISRAVGIPRGARAHHTHCAGKVTLGADAVAAIRRQLRRIHNRSAVRRRARTHFLNVRLSGPVAPFAGDAAFPERRIGVAVQSARYHGKKAGMAVQAGRHHGPRHIRISVPIVRRSQIPPGGGGIVSHGSFVKESIRRQQVTARHRSRAHKPGQRLIAVQAAAGRFFELHGVASGALAHAIAEPGSAMGEGGACQRFRGSRVPGLTAGRRHGSPTVAVVNGTMTRRAGSRIRARGHRREHQER